MSKRSEGRDGSRRVPWERHRRTAIAWVVTSMIGACAGSTATDGGNTDGHTSWLAACEADEDCEAGFSCQCGACTVACRDSAECSELPAPAACLEVSESSAPDTCRLAVPSSSSGVCLPTGSADADCEQVREGFTCMAGVCVGPTFSAAPPTPDGGGPRDAGDSRDAASDSSSLMDAGPQTETDGSVSAAECDLETYAPPTCATGADCP